MVGFHHKVGSQVEYIYPPINEDKEGNLSAEFLKQIPLIALPDGSHLTEVSNSLPQLCRADMSISSFEITKTCIIV